MRSALQLTNVTGQPGALLRRQAAFHLAEQQYKRLIRQKQRAWQLQQLRQHLCNLNRDPRMLWRSCNASRNALPESLRDPSCWNAFRDRLALRTPPADCHLPDGLDTPHISPAVVDCLNAAVITRGEVTQALAGLHNGRASGSSELAAEFLRYASWGSGSAGRWPYQRAR